MVHRPGFEPGYPAWKAGVLDQSRPSMLLLLKFSFYFILKSFRLIGDDLGSILEIIIHKVIPIFPKKHVIIDTIMVKNTKNHTKVLTYSTKKRRLLLDTLGLFFINPLKNFDLLLIVNK